jgi:hypothetical protein
MPDTWFHKFFETISPPFQVLPSAPHRSLSEQIARTLWAIERIEQRNRRRQERSGLRDSHDALER